MQILVANLGSTSFKYRLFDVTGSQARMLANNRQSRQSIGKLQNATIQ